MTERMTTDRLAALRQEIEALPRWDKRSVPGGFHVNRAAVLDLIDKYAAGVTVAQPAPDLLRDDDLTPYAGMTVDEVLGPVTSDFLAGVPFTHNGQHRPEVCADCGFGRSHHGPRTFAQPAPEPIPPAPFCDHANQRVVRRMNCPDCGCNGAYVEEAPTADREWSAGWKAGYESGKRSLAATHQPAPDLRAEDWKRKYELGEEENVRLLQTQLRQMEKIERLEAALDAAQPAPETGSLADDLQTHHQPDTTCPICRYVQDHLAQPAPDLRAAAQAVVEAVDDGDGMTDEPAIAAAILALRAALATPQPAEEEDNA